LILVSGKDKYVVISLSCCEERCSKIKNMDGSDVIERVVQLVDDELALSSLYLFSNNSFVLLRIFSSANSRDLI